MKLHRVLLLLIVVATLVSYTPARADTQSGVPVFFPETGHTLAYSFRQFYDRQGGLQIFGLPLTEVYIQDGRPVQVFERARLEWHADVGLTLAGHLGRWAAQGREKLPAFQPINVAPPDATFFPETRHSLGGAFRDFWNANGGLATFGYPISEMFAETNAQDGQTYMVQYLERARFELHPEAPPQYRVLLGHLGRQHLAANPAPEWAMQPVSSASQAWDGVRPTHISIPRIGVDVDITETGFTYAEWDVPRYTAAHYWPVSAFPGTPGNIIVAGHVGYRGIIFSQLPSVQTGDEVYLQVAGQDRRYIVREVLTLLPSETWVMAPTPSETLTLITCIPVGVYSHRLIVRAEPA
jgi:LPXTG-site transpeptidase (sortase) family protein